MSRRKSKQSQSGFGKLLFWTLVLSIVFSAGLIAGQRVLLHDSLPPLVSVPAGMPALSASTRQPVKSSETEDGAEGDLAGKGPVLTFYEQLARPAERFRRQEEPPRAPKPKPEPVAV